MTTDKLIAQQMKRVETLQKTLFDQKPGRDDLAKTSELRKERAMNVRISLERLRRHRKDTVAALDVEIADLEAELNELERRTDLDFALQRSGAAQPAKTSRR